MLRIIFIIIFSFLFQNCTLFSKDPDEFKRAKENDLSRYEVNGNISYIKLETFDTNYVFLHKIESWFNNDGNLNKELFNDAGTGFYEYEYIYDEQDFLIEFNIIASILNRNVSFYYTNNLYGDIIEAKGYDVNDSLIYHGTQNYEYNSDGRIVKYIIDSKLSGFDKEITYVYDINGKVIEIREIRYF